MKIASLRGKQILDSRGNPTVRVILVLDDGSTVEADVPSGASKGTNEALELRDHDPDVFSGEGVLTACHNVELLFEIIRDYDVRAQQEIDLAMIQFDGTPNKSRIGANAMLGVSIAVMKAAALSSQKACYQQINETYNTSFRDTIEPSLPCPLFNLINGGAHANNRLDFQEFIMIPFQYKGMQGVLNGSYKANTAPAQAREYVRKGAEILHQLQQNLRREGYESGVGDEGGDSITISYAKTALNLLCEAVTNAGYSLYDDISFGIDCASNYFYDKESNTYTINKYSKLGKKVCLDEKELRDFYTFFLDNYPIIYLEDPFAEEAWDSFHAFMNERKDNKVAISGDDLVVTNTERLLHAIQAKAINTMIVKPNQIGTLYETFQVVHMCRENNILYIPSHRSGETNDPFITDLASGLGAVFMKTGAPQRGERVAKYNRLLEIADTFEK